MDDKQFQIAARISGLIIKYVNKSITPDELTELHNWAYTNETNREIFEEWLHSNEFQDSLDYMIDLDKETAFREIQYRIGIAQETVVQMPVNRWRTRIAIAASIILLIGISAGLYLRTHGKTGDDRSQAAQIYKNDAAPGGDKAILTLANGSRIVLDNAQNGTLAQQGNTKVQKLGSGQLNYTAGSAAPETINYNTLSTPRGGQYQVILPDGTKVWLNAASSLRYPTAFTGRQRAVELTGEGYFEVAKDATMPFKVKVNDMTVKVLGTNFNVMAYDEEAAIKTTLLTGAVQVSQGSVDRSLKPGDQAQVAVDGKIKVVDDINVDNTVAWKNGYFYFDKVDIKTVLRQLARWYDVQVAFEGPIPAQHFGGKIQRNLLLSQVLEILETNNVHFKIEGKKLTVLY